MDSKHCPPVGDVVSSTVAVLLHLCVLVINCEVLSTSCHAVLFACSKLWDVTVVQCTISDWRNDA